MLVSPAVGAAGTGYATAVNAILDSHEALLAGQRVFNLAGKGAELDGSTDDTGVLEAGIDFINADGGVLWHPGGNLLSTASLPPVTHPGASILGPGPGTAKFSPTNNGDFLTLQLDPFTVEQTGRYGGCTIDGPSGVDAVGVHGIDMSSALFEDLVVKNFIGGRGMWLENELKWTERNIWQKVHLDNNKESLVLSTQDPAKYSFGYNKFLSLMMNVNDGQTGLVTEDNIFAYSILLFWITNVIDAGVVLDMRDTSQINGLVGIEAELTQGSGGTARKIASGATFHATGHCAFYGLVDDIEDDASHASKFRVGLSAKGGDLNTSVDGGSVADFQGSGVSAEVVPVVSNSLLDPQSMLAFLIGAGIVSPLLTCYAAEGNAVVFGKQGFSDVPGEYVELAHIDVDGKLVFLKDEIANLYRVSAATLATDGDFELATLGKGLKIKVGSNASLGSAVLAGGTVTVPNTRVSFGSVIQCTTQVPGGTVGTPYIYSRTEGVSFTIRSTESADTSTVGWWMVDGI